MNAIHNMMNPVPALSRILVLGIMACALALLALSPNIAQAQSSIEELDLNVNSDGKERLGTTKRVFAEIGMGIVGELTAAAAGAIWRSAPIMIQLYAGTF